MFIFLKKTLFQVSGNGLKRVLAPTSIYDFQAGIQIYLGQQSLANINTNVFGWTFLGKYEYKYIWIQIFDQMQIQIYWVLPKNRQI